MFDKTIDKDITWMDNAACMGLDPEIFFVARGEDDRPAKAICKECFVKQQCLDFALSIGERFGVWGGLSERERRQIRTRKRKEQKIA